MAIISSSELVTYKNDQLIVDKVALQIQKDFQLYDEKIEFSGKQETAYDELFNQIKPVIFRMLELDSARFFSLLYAIDVEEKKVRTLLLGNEEADVATELTHLILERELLKVVTRQLFSQQSNI
ncbi:MAG: flavodoxin [Vicingaceae bacterium]|jgi:flavodoxin